MAVAILVEPHEHLADRFLAAVGQLLIHRSGLELVEGKLAILVRVSFFEQHSLVHPRKFTRCAAHRTRHHRKTGRLCLIEGRD